MKAASNSNRRYFFGNVLTRPKSKHHSRGSSASSRKIHNSPEVNQTLKEYFPDSDSNANHSSTFSNILSPTTRNHSRDLGHGRISHDLSANSSEKSTRFLFEK